MAWRTLWHRHPDVRSGEQLTVGERAADRMRNSMGSWFFVGGFLLFMGVWITLNTLLHLGGSDDADSFDEYPYILLNLMLSMMAGLQGAVLLIAAKRADQVASELATSTYQNTIRLQELTNRNAELIEAVRRLTEDVHAATVDTREPT